MDPDFGLVCYQLDLVPVADGGVGVGVLAR